MALRSRLYPAQRLCFAKKKQVPARVTHSVWYVEASGMVRSDEVVVSSSYLSESAPERKKEKVLSDTGRANYNIAAICNYFRVSFVSFHIAVSFDIRDPIRYLPIFLIYRI